MQINRLISLILGIIVVILLLTWIRSRLQPANKTTASVAVTVTPTAIPTGAQKGWDFFSIFKKATPTPTPATTVTEEEPNTVSYVSPTPTQNTPINYYKKQTVTPTPASVVGVKSIPQTGAPTLLLPLAFGAMFGGAALKKTKKQS